MWTWTQPPTSLPLTTNLTYKAWLSLLRGGLIIPCLKCFFSINYFLKDIYKLGNSLPLLFIIPHYLKISQNLRCCKTMSFICNQQRPLHKKYTKEWLMDLELALETPRSNVYCGFFNYFSHTLSALDIIQNYLPDMKLVAKSPSLCSFFSPFHHVSDQVQKVI